MMKRTVITLLAGSALLPALAFGGNLDKSFSKQFEAPPGTVLHVDHGDGDLVITPWDQPTIDVQVVYRGETKSVGFGKDGDFTVEFSQEGNQVRVTGKETSGSSFGFRYERIDEYRYTIQAPAYVTLELKGDDGSVTVESWKADVNLKLDDGDLRLAGVTGNVSLDLEDADAVLTGLQGALRLKADDGDVQVDDSALKPADFRLEDGDVSLKDCSGDITVKVDDGDVRFSRVALATGRIEVEDGNVDLGIRGGADLDLEIHAGDGSVQVELEPGMSTRFAVETEDGHIHLDLGDVSDLDQGPMRVSGKVGAGKGRIAIRTEAGNVTVRDVPAGN